MPPRSIGRVERNVKTLSEKENKMEKEEKETKKVEVRKGKKIQGSGSFFLFHNLIVCLSSS